MAGLGAVGSVGWTRCGCDAVQTCRGLYTIPMRVSPPRSSVRVVAQVGKSGQGRAKKTTSNAVDANAASLNSAADDVESRVSSGNVLRSGGDETEEKKVPGISPQQLLMQRLKLDKALDEVVGFMAPRDKGDIRDVILMSLSFAVLVYISQRLVCLYCVVRHMTTHPF